MMTKTICFEPIDELFTGLTSSKTHTPQWYKDSPKFLSDKPSSSTKALKLCVPFLDAMTSGYMLTLAGDVVVSQVNGLPEFSFSVLPLISVRNPETAGKMPIPYGHSPVHAIWTTPSALSLPKGYSMLVTHPLNRFDLPFTTMSGIVDECDLNGGSLPFFLREGFEGVIPQGTPIAQILPFKREDWKATQEAGLAKRAEINGKRAGLVLYGWYKKNIWKKKSYN